MTRSEGWEQRLADHVASCESLAFAWGVHDCCAFTAGAVEAMCGRNPMAYHRGYTTAVGAARVIREAGGIEAIPVKHGLSRLPSPSMAQRGDVVSVEIGGRTSLGVCVGVDAVFASKPAGLARRKLAECSAAWRI